MAKLTCFSTSLENVKGEKCTRLSSERENIWIRQVKLASSCKLTELSHRLNGTIRLFCVIPFPPSCHGCTRTIFLREQRMWAVPHTTPPSTARILLRSNGVRQSNASAQEVRQEPWVPREKTEKVRTIRYKEPISGMEKSASRPRCCHHCFRLETSGSRCWPPCKMRTLRNQSQEEQ